MNPRFSMVLLFIINLEHAVSMFIKVFLTRSLRSVISVSRDRNHTQISGKECAPLRIWDQLVFKLIVRTTCQRIAFI